MEQKKTSISILIPVYNTACIDFVSQLQKMAAKSLLTYEIIVVDDASTDEDCLAKNQQLSQVPNCLYIIKKVNTGSAATRNFLARQSRFPWLLFLDCDMQLTDANFLERYLTPLPSQVINGGVSIGGDPSVLGSNLRYCYEKAEEPHHTAAMRQKQPYKSFRSTNFLISREVMLNCPFDERFQHSGYEDVLFGKQLKLHHISVTHIDNPVLMTDYEDNVSYLQKVERSLHTLHQHRQELKGYSRLLTLTEGIHLKIVRKSICLIYRFLGASMRRNLCGRHPSQNLFKLYRLSYYLSIKN